MTDKTLFIIWASVCNNNAWLEKLRKMGLTDRNLAYLAALDEDFNHGLKEARWRSTLLKWEAREHFEAQETPEHIYKCRREYVNQQIQRLHKEIAELYTDYEKLRRMDKPVSERAFILADIPEKEKELKRLEMEKYCQNQSGDITPEKIIHARNYPIESLVDINSRGFALCVFHDEKTPSMYCKNNFAWCFSCQQGGSVIDVAMKKYNLTFIQAVKKLCT